MPPFPAVARVWWRARVRELGVANDPATDSAGHVDRFLLTHPEDDHVCGLDEPLAEAKVVEQTAYNLGELYTAELGAAERDEHGRHYTPQLLAEELWAELAAADPELVATGTAQDPAAGAGALLLPPLRAAVAKALAEVERGERAPAEALTEVAGRFRGRDLDPFAVELGNLILTAELLPLWARIHATERQAFPQLLSVGDGLAPAEATNIAVLNPPYGRVRLDETERRRWAHVLAGHANRYQLHLAAAVSQTAPGGLIGAVIPASFLGGAYFRRLRSWLAVEAPLARLVFVADRAGVFAGVLQETCLAVFRRQGPGQSIACARLTVNGAVERQDLGETPLPTPSSPASEPNITDQHNTPRNDRRPATAGDGDGGNGNGKVAAPRGSLLPTLDLSELPWPLPRAARDARLVRRASNLPARLSDYGWRASTGPLVWNRHKDQLHAEHAHDRVPIVWAADLDGDSVRPDSVRDPQRYFAPRDRDQFMVLREPAVLVQRTTAPEQPRRLLAATLDQATIKTWGGAVVIENHVNVLRCQAADSPLTPRVLTALLDSDALDRLYRCLTGSVAVSAYELHALPLPGERALSRWSELDPQELREVIENYYRR